MLSSVVIVESVIDEVIWNVGGIILTGENGSNRRKLCRTSFTTNPTRTGVDLNPGLRVESSAATSLSHNMAVKWL